ncbi:MAG: methyltransferase domain-containing protein, partial [Deltaproteobacteria bacterium]|nr:methyltransferase domain-containing protein [Deltaproteobacteria bacterium]
AIDPEKVLCDAGLKEGDFFADIGSGPGFFSIPASKIVGVRGVVFAIDTQKEMLLDLRDRNPPDNIVLLVSEEDSIPLGDSETDFALMAYMLHETVSMDAFLKEVRRVLRPGGTALVIDWKKQKEEHGPPEEERLTEEQAAANLKKAGFKVVSVTSLNPSHYRILAERE